MKFSKTQQEVYENLLQLLTKRGRAWLLGWALGQLIRISEHDPELRLRIRRRLKD